MLDSILFEDEAEVESLPRGSYESVLRGFGTAWPGSRVVVSGGTSSSEDVLLLQLVRVSPMPVAVLDLRSRLIVAASEGAAALFGTNADEAAGTAWDRLTDEPERTREALDLMARGGIDAYEARRRLRRPDGTAVPVYLWLRHLAPQGYPDRALVFLTPHGPQHRDSDPSEFPRIAPSTPDVTVGTTDPEWRVDRITPGIEQLLGSSNAQFQDGSVFGLVHPDDARALLDAITRTVTDRVGVGLTLRLRRMDDDWVDVRMVVSADSQDMSPRTRVRDDHGNRASSRTCQRKWSRTGTASRGRRADLATSCERDFRRLVLHPQ